MVDFMYLLLLLRLSQIPGGFKIIFSGQYCPDFPIPTWVLNHRTWRNLFRHAWGDYCLDKKVTKKNPGNEAIEPMPLLCTGVLPGEGQRCF